MISLQIEKTPSTRIALVCKIACGLILAFICASFMSVYWNIFFEPILRIVLFALIAYSLYKLSQEKLHSCEIIVWATFSLLLSLSFVLGKHINLAPNIFISGTIESVNISSYGPIDAAAFLFIGIGAFILATQFYIVCKSRLSLDRDSSQDQCNSGFSFKCFFLILAIIFICYIPYFLIYYPGLIFGDSLNSLRQALDINGYNCRHPVMYTLYLKLCISVSNSIGHGTTFGIALYSLTQMMFMAGVFSFTITWLRARFSLSWKVITLLIVFFGVYSYNAVYSVAVWKDPIFSCAIVLITVLLADAVLQNRPVLKNNSVLVLYTLAAVLVFICRKNGIYVLLLVSVVIAAYYVVCFLRKSTLPSRMLANILISSIAVCVLCSVAIGYLEDQLDVDMSESKIEAYGMLVNQMAAVAAHDGEMSDSDRDYLNKLFPISEYSSTYNPSNIDPLKWDKRFDRSVLDHGFFTHWVSMLIRNPQYYFEAWELQTVGYWCLNQEVINTIGASCNMQKGYPRNTNPDKKISAKYDLEVKNLTGSETLRKIFPQDTWVIPLSYINWFVLFLCCCMILQKRYRLMLPLVPTLVIIITLLVASPVAYWARYGAMEHFLIPVYIALLVATFKSYRTGFVSEGKHVVRKPRHYRHNQEMR